MTESFGVINKLSDQLRLKTQQLCSPRHGDVDLPRSFKFNRLTGALSQFTTNLVDFLQDLQAKKTDLTLAL